MGEGKIWIPLYNAIMAPQIDIDLVKKLVDNKEMMASLDDDTTNDMLGHLAYTDQREVAPILTEFIPKEIKIWDQTVRDLFAHEMETTLVSLATRGFLTNEQYQQLKIHAKWCQQMIMRFRLLEVHVSVRD